MSALLNCPFCGHTALTQRGTVGYQVQCVAEDCAAEGPYVASRDQAEAAWNRRTSPPPPTREALTAALAVIPTGLRNQAMHLPPAMAEAAADAVLRLLGGENGND